MSERTARAKLWRQEREGWPGTSQCLRLEQSVWQDGKGVDIEGGTKISCLEVSSRAGYCYSDLQLLIWRGRKRREHWE